MGRGRGKGGDDEEVAMVCLGVVACGCVVWVGGGLLTLIFATCDDGSCSDGSCWWGCDCSPCPAGTACSGIGAQDCDSLPEPCAPGTFAAAGSAECSDCSFGTYSGGGEGTASCSDCDAGRFAGPTSSSCGPCDAGKFSSSPRSASCDACPSGSISSAGFSRCQSCSRGKYCNPSHTSCIDCAAGYFSTDSLSSACTLCGPGTVSGRGSISCRACRRGQFSDAARIQCLDCAPGQFGRVRTTYVECDLCGAGQFARSPGSTQCSECAQGTHSGEGATHCAECPAGQFSTSGTTCNACATGRFSSVASAAECQACTRGTYSEEGQAHCRPCPAGKYGPENRSGFCEPCEAGKASPHAGASQCEPCVPRRAAPVGATTCHPCPPGSYELSRSCQTCAAGKFSTGTSAGSATGNTCADCALGRISYAGVGSCQPCPPGSFEINRTNCQTCGAGKFSTGTAASSSTGNNCVDCAPGRIAADAGAGTCADCPAGKFEYAHLRCHMCAAGNFSNVSSSSCSLCSNFHPIRRACSMDFVDVCPIDQIQAECDVCGSQGDCSVGEGYCNKKTVCDSCSTLTTGSCDVLGGDCCNAFVLKQCPSADIGTCSFCRGDVLDCEFTTWLTVGWLISVFCVTLLNRGAPILTERGPDKAKVVILAVMFILPKAIFVGGVAMASSGTSQFILFAGHAVIYPFLGFLVVAATLVTAAAGVMLSPQFFQQGQGQGRNLISFFISVLYLVLIFSISAHAVIAGLFSSQREICTVNLGLDISQLFVIQAMAISCLNKSNAMGNLFAAAFSTWDTCNCIFMALHGIWAPWPSITLAKFASFICVTVVKHLLLLYLYKNRALRVPVAVGQTDLDSSLTQQDSHSNPVAADTAGLALAERILGGGGMIGTANLRMITDGDIVVGQYYLHTPKHRTQHMKKTAAAYVKIFEILTITTALLATGVLFTVSAATVVDKYFLVCLVSIFLPHIGNSPFVIQFVVFLILTFFDFEFLGITRAGVPFTVGQMWSSIFLLVCDNYCKRAASKRTEHCLKFMPFFAHMLYVFSVIIWWPLMVSKGFAVVMLVADILVCVAKSWESLKAISEAHGTAVPLTKLVWIGQWASIVTSGCMANAMPTSMQTIVCFSLLCFGGLILGFVMPRCNTPKKTSIVVGLYSIAVDGIPTFFFVVNTITGTAAQQKASLVGITFVFKTFLFCRLSIFGVKSNWDNDEPKMWTTSFSSAAAFAWFYVVLQSMLTVWSITRGMESAVFAHDPVLPPCIATNTACGNYSDGSYEFCQTLVPDSVCLSGQCNTPAACYRALGEKLDARTGETERLDWDDSGSSIGDSEGVITACTNLSHTSNTLMPLDEGLLEDDGFMFQCAPVDIMMSVDSSYFLATTFLFTLFAGEYVCKKAGDGESPWPDSILATVTENTLQVVLSGQVLYAMLRLRIKMDPLYVCYVTLDLLFILLLMLSRQLRTNYGKVSAVDWGVMFLLESWDVANALVVTVTLAHAHDHQTFAGYPVADVYTGIFVITLLSFQLSYPFWTSLKRIAWISCFNDICTDVPMIYMMAVYSLYHNNPLCGIAIFVNICIISFALFIWPLKYYIKAQEKQLRESQAPGHIADDTESAPKAITKDRLVRVIAMFAVVLAFAVVLSGAFTGWWGNNNDLVELLQEQFRFNGDNGGKVVAIVFVAIVLTLALIGGAAFMFFRRRGRRLGTF